MSALRRVAASPHLRGLLAVAVLIGLNLLKDPGYLSISYNAGRGALVGNLVDIARAAAPVLMVATGMCLVVATKGIDLSVGSMMAVGGAVAMEYLSRAAAPTSLGAAAVAVLLALGLCAVLGLINGMLVAYVGLQPFITTLVMMLAGRGVAKVITGGQNRTATNDKFRWIANGYVFGLPVVALIAVVVALLVALVVRRTALGMLVEAIGINPVASRLAGINGRGLLVTVYIVSAVLGGVAGLMATGSVMTVDVSQTGYQLELDAILAVVIGGTSLAGGKFSLGGAALGALLIATLDKTVVFLGVPSSATPAFKAAVIIVIYLIQSGRLGAVAGAARGRLRREHARPAAEGVA